MITTIRPYRDQDWAQVCRVHDRARPVELRQAGVDPGAFRPMSQSAAEDEFFDSETLVACRGRDVVGFVSWHGAYVTWLYVDPAHHRSGVGRMLMEAAVQRIGPHAWLNTMVGNQPAVGLYQTMGMEIVKEWSGTCDGFPCRVLRMALPTSPMADPAARRARDPAASAKESSW